MKFLFIISGFGLLWLMAYIAIKSIASNDYGFASFCIADFMFIAISLNGYVSKDK